MGRRLVDVVFETHSTTEDNESSVATGWLHGRLSAAGEDQARRLGDRRRADGLAAIFSSDLGRARQTVEIAFPVTQVPVLYDWRLRECDYGAMNGCPVGDLEREAHVDVPYPDGECWRDAISRVETALRDIAQGWDDGRVLIIGHTATRWALDHAVHETRIEDLVSAPFAWREGWEYRLPVDL